MVTDELAEWAQAVSRRVATSGLPPIRVLVWGPGSAADQPGHPQWQLRQKRLSIVRELRRLGIAAATSEELAEMEAGDAPLHVVERMQAEEADFVVLLLAGEGSVAELAGIGISRQVARRTALFVDRRRVAGGYLDLGPLESVRRLVQEVAYDDEDMTRCAVASLAVQLAVDQAVSLRGTQP